MNKNISIDGRIIGPGHSSFIIGELSGNHHQSFDIALKSVDAMHEAGVECLKLQTATPESITINCDNEFFRINEGTKWDGKTLYELYQEVYTPWEWHKPLKDYAESKGMIFFSSPFSKEAVDFLEELDVPAYKIASFEIFDIPLIKYAASKGKPIIISTGIAEEEDIQDAIDACLEVGNENVVLLKCTSAYPTPLEEVNLRAMNTLEEKYDCLTGISDHTLGHLVPLGAVSLGAKVIEKHFILDRGVGGADAGFSMEPSEFKKMVEKVRMLEEALGSSELFVSEKVKKSRRFARSLFVVKDIAVGEEISEDNVKSIRPGNGMKPKYYEQILGKIVTRNLERGTPLTFEVIKE